jgi:glycosyltransferase involved in cell wall biosynthesis
VKGHAPDAYAAALVPFLCDARVRAAAGEAGRRRAGRFSWDRTATATMDVYREVLRERVPAVEALPGRRGA